MPTASLSACDEAGGGLLLVALAVGPALARSYTAPGQYVELITPAARGYFVLAGPVGESPWELLVKNAGDVAEALVAMPVGSAVDLAGPMGAGFDLARVASRPVVVAVVGSAVAVARPVLAARIAQGAAGSTFLFLGLRAPTDLPIAAEVSSWSERGVHVVLCLSRSELDHHPEILPLATRAGGYVQDALARAVEAGVVPPGALALVAGPDAMLAALRGFATAYGAANRSATPIEIVTNV